MHILEHQEKKDEFQKQVYEKQRQDQERERTKVK